MNTAMVGSALPHSSDTSSSKRTKNRRTFLHSRFRKGFWLLLILVMHKSVRGSKLCTETTLVGTKDTGHYVFYESPSQVDIVQQNTAPNERSKHSFLRNHNWPGALGYPPLPLIPNTTLELRIASCNIRAPFPKDRGPDCKHPFAWKSRVNAVAEQINFYHPDVIGIQEDTHYQITQLQSYLSDYQYVGVNRDDCETSPDEANSPLNPFGVTRYDGDCAASKKPEALVHGGEFNSIWYRPDVLDLQSWGVFWLGSTTAERGSHFLNSTCTLGHFSPFCDVGRVVTWASLRPKAQPYNFFVFNTHVTSNAEGNKKTPATIIRKIKDIAGTRLSYTLGDFNTAQRSQTYKINQSYLNDPDFPHANEPPPLRQWPPSDQQ